MKFHANRTNSLSTGRSKRRVSWNVVAHSMGYILKFNKSSLNQPIFKNKVSLDSWIQGDFLASVITVFLIPTTPHRTYKSKRVSTETAAKMTKWSEDQLVFRTKTSLRFISPMGHSGYHKYGYHRYQKNPLEFRILMIPWLVDLMMTYSTLKCSPWSAQRRSKILIF